MPDDFRRRFDTMLPLHFDVATRGAAPCCAAQLPCRYAITEVSLLP